MIQLRELHKIAGGLNIEGGFPARDLLKFNPKGKWANLILVLDRPLIDNIVFDDIFANNAYPLLENAIDNLNEKHFLAAFLMIISYFLENGRSICDICETSKFSMMVHIHQDVKSITLVNLIESLIQKLFPIDSTLEGATCSCKSGSRNCENNFAGSDIMANINLQYRTDNGNYLITDVNYEDYDLVLSLSQCAGIDEKYRPGDLLIADNFIPFNIDHQLINVKNSYQEKNILVDYLSDILASRYNSYWIGYLNENYTSSNPNKLHSASLLTPEMFYTTNILQVDKLWNPIDENEIVNVNN